MRPIMSKAVQKNIGASTGNLKYYDSNRTSPRAVGHNKKNLSSYFLVEFCLGFFRSWNELILDYETHPAISDSEPVEDTWGGGGGVLLL